MANIISLMTDFGHQDQYVGVMKSVIINRNPVASIVDITHEIKPQNLNQAKFLTKCSYDYFPDMSVHLIVVDPDVGTDREIIILETSEAFFIAPDNGVLSQVVQPYVCIDDKSCDSLIRPSGSCKLYALDQEQYWNQPLSNTFHGRDIFAPVGALLARGENPSQFGKLVSAMTYDPIPVPMVDKDFIEGEIIYVDHFGNLISNIDSKYICRGKRLEINLGGLVITNLGETFNQEKAIGDFVALIGSHDHLEISIYKGDAAKTANIGEGTKITVQYS